MARLFVGDDLCHGAYLVLLPDGSYIEIVNTDNLAWSDEVEDFVATLRELGYHMLASIVEKLETGDVDAEKLALKVDCGYQALVEGRH